MYTKYVNRLQKPPEMSSNPALRPLRVVEAQKEGKRALNYLHTIEGLPWKSYEKIYDLRLGVSDPVTVAEGKGISCDLVSIRRFSGAGVDQKLEMIRLIQHKNFVTAHEVYRRGDECDVVSLGMPIHSSCPSCLLADTKVSSLDFSFSLAGAGFRE